MTFELGKLYKIKGNVPVRTNNGYIMGAYLFHPRNDFFNKNTIWNTKPIVENDTIVMIVQIPMYPNHDGVHVLYEDKVYFVKNENIMEI